MLSDEERKAIENLKIEYEKLIKEDNILFPLYKSDAKRLIDIIEKQSKEIEELKQFKKQVEEIESTNFIKYKNYISKDKIKAKIEEIDKILERNLLVDSLRDYFKAQKEVLQSLLEKE